MADRTSIGRLGLTGLDLAQEPFGYTERLELTQVLSGNYAIMGDQAVGATTASLTVYVDQAGSDSNPGSLALPVRTVQRALDLVPKLIRHPVVVSIGTGSFTGSMVQGFTIAPATAVGGAWLTIQGAMSGATLSTINSGTVSAATVGSAFTLGWGTLTASNSPNWATNEARGMIVAITSGTGAGQVRVIKGNNANDLQIHGRWDVTPDTTSGFQIQLPATAIIANSASIPIKNTGQGFTSTTGYGFFVQNNVTGESPLGGATDITFKNMSFTGSAGLTINDAVYKASNGGAVTVQGVVINTIDDTSGICLMLNAGGFAAVTDCVLSGNFRNGTFYKSQVGGAPGTIPNGNIFRCFDYRQVSPFLLFGDAGSVSMASNVHLGPSPASPNPIIGYGVPGYQSVNITTTYVSGTTKGLVAPLNNGTTFTSPLFNITANTLKFENCTTVAQMDGPGFMQLTGLTGSGNGTLFNITKGAKARIDSTTSINGSTTAELNIDGTIVTLATMRAGSPIHATGSQQAIFGTIAFQ